MSSRDIAELTGKQHKDVLYDTRRMLEELEIQSADFSADYKDGRGRTQKEFRLPKDLTLTLVTGYDVKRRHAINVPMPKGEKEILRHNLKIK
jgi:anti-repressor protein